MTWPILVDHFTFDGKAKIVNMKILRAKDKASSMSLDVFNISRIELYSEDNNFYQIGAPKNGYFGQKVEIIGDGKAQRSNDPNVVWQGGNDFKFRTILKGEVIELFLNFDGKWYERPISNWGQYILYRSGTPVGNVIPLYPWQDCFDTLGKKWYKATGTSSVNDWVALN